MAMEADHSGSFDGIVIFYDGQCPVCSNFVQMKSLSRMWEVKLVDVRRCKTRAEVPSSVRDVDFNNEMSILVRDRLLRGHEAFMFLSLTSSGSVRALGRFLSVLPRPVQQAFYYSLVRLRLVLLTVLGRKPLSF